MLNRRRRNESRSENKGKREVFARETGEKKTAIFTSVPHSTPFFLFLLLILSSPPSRHALATVLPSHSTKKKTKHATMTKRRPNSGGGNGGANEHCPEKVRFFFLFLLVTLVSGSIVGRESYLVDVTQRGRRESREEDCLFFRCVES